VSASIPSLERIELDGLAVHMDLDLRRTDEVIVAFTERFGGVSAPPYDSLNLAGHVGDDPECVDSNRSALLGVLGLENLRARLVTAEQVHGAKVHEVTDRDSGRGAFVSHGAPPVAETDALMTAELGIPLLLLYADCVPVILVGGHPAAIAVVHAGWRGALADLPGATVLRMARAYGLDPSGIRAYLGPCIRSCCYNVQETILSQFVHEFGTISAVEGRLDLVAVVRESLRRAGLLPEMIADCGACTLDHVDRFFSYRANATTGRHGALAAIMKVE